MTQHPPSTLIPIAALLSLAACRSPEGLPPTSPPAVARAHAHNDYEHPRPLLDALELGFLSVEADIYLRDGRLLVGHEEKDLRPGRTLEALYLDPLRERSLRNGGPIHSRQVDPGGTEFILLIDVKTEAESTYAALKQVLEGYRGILTSVEGGREARRPVRAILSGERPIATLSAESSRLAGLDGRLSDLPSKLPAHLMPLISDHWGRNFRWDGTGPMSADEKEKLRGIVLEAHREGRKLRFWATPDTPVFWGELLESGVDLINTDDLAGLSAFLRPHPGAHSGPAPPSS